MKLTPDQLRQNAAAMLALADGKPVEFLSSEGVWKPTGFVDCSYPHRPKAAWRLPEPPKGHRWHNPANVPIEKLGGESGWRWLTDLEVKSAYESTKYRREIQKWSSGDWDGSNWVGSSPEYTYRTTLPAPAPVPAEPVVRPWSFETAPVDFKIRSKASGKVGRAHSHTDLVRVWWAIGIADTIEYQQLLEDFTQLDGSPCGITEASK